ncbi:MAG: GNAT family N-acetyltransferase [Bdellovibrionales bacterium]
MAITEEIRAWVKNFPDIKTDRVLARPLQASDDQILYQAMQNPRVNKWVGGFQQPFDLAAARRWLSKRLDVMDSGEGLYLAAFYNGVQELMGFMYIRFWEHDDVEVAGALNELYWGKGFAEEVAIPLIDKMFNKFGFNRVWASTALENRSSIRLLTALGFTYEGQKMIPTPDGSGRVSNIFGVTREGWANRPLQRFEDDPDPAEIAARRRALIKACQEARSRAGEHG